jgi:two-component system chemotaxis response regulator CheB
MCHPDEQLVRVLVADDSEIAATCLERVVEEDSRIRVVGRARDGTELLESPAVHVAHVILLDALMPKLAGLSALRHLASRLPVIVVSSEAVDSAVAREALAQGARAFFSKAELSAPQGQARLREAVLQTGLGSQPPSGSPVVLIAGSTGAVGPLAGLLRDLREVKVPQLVVQHFPEGKDDALTHTLSLSGVTVRPAEHGDRLLPGALVAPFGRHMLLNRSERIHLVDAPAVNGHRPSAEVLLASAARLGERAVAVMLSGLSNDGARAMAALAEQGATCLAQHPDDCTAPSMPMAALAASPAVRSVRVADLGRRVRRHLDRDR